MILCLCADSVSLLLVQIDKLLSSFHQWERAALDAGERLHVSKELLAGCESIEWQVFVLCILTRMDYISRKPVALTALKYWSLNYENDLVLSP